MNFAEALEFSKKFPAAHPKVFKGFFEWGICDTETEGYVVLTDTTLANDPSSNQLEDYVKRHKLKIDHGKDHLIIYTRP